MRLSCGIVIRMVAGRTGEELPGWVSRHVSRCPHCAAEAAAYERLQSVVRDNMGTSEPSGLSWQTLRSTLPMPEPMPMRKSPAFALFAAALVLVVIACASVFVNTGDRTVQTVQQTPFQNRKSADEPARSVVQPVTPGKTQPKTVAPATENRPQRRPVLKRLSPLRLQVNRNLQRPATRQTLPSIEEKPGANVVAAPDPAHRYKVVAAEEHVINVIDVSTAGEPDSQDTDYVIRTTGSDEEQTVALL